MEGAVDGLGERFERMQIGDITVDHRTLQGTMPAVLDGGGGLVQCFAGASTQYGAGAEFGELQGNSSANAASGAGDDGDLAGQSCIRCSFRQERTPPREHYSISRQWNCASKRRA